MPSLSTDHFCELIQAEVQLGKGFIPLVGAGLSASAGIPVRVELSHYLQLCVVKALGLDNRKRAHSERWHPRRNAWPAMRGQWLAVAKKGIKDLNRVITFEVEKGAHRLTNYQNVCRQAYGALSDWRLTLQFLSRIRNSSPISGAAEAAGEEKFLHERGELAREVAEQVMRQPEVLLGDIDANVIDSFFNFLVGGKTPAMGHRLIVHLSEILRSKLVLTFNFDDLLEQAYRELNIEPGIFDVHLQAGLPQSQLLGRRPAIVKLHGGRYGLRADFSLDREPQERDRENFRGYFQGEDDVTPAEPAGGKRPVRYHLFVAGVSAQDYRIRELIAEALEKLDLKVFWCCYSQHDEEDIERYFGPHVRTGNMCCVRFVHLGLLLWEIYQRVTRCLPPGGLEFPTMWQLPTPPRLLEGENSAIEDLYRWFEKKIKRWPGPRTNGLILETPEMPPGGGPAWGVTGLAWHFFQQRSKDARCVWLEADELSGPDELKVRLLQSIASLSGQAHQKPPIEFDTDRKGALFREELLDLISGSGRDWTVFFYLRGTPGYYTGEFKDLKRDPFDIRAGERFEEWAARRQKQTGWSGKARKEVAALIETIAKIKRRGLSVVVVRRGNEFPIKDKLFRTVRLEVPVEPAKKNWAKTRAEAARAWMNAGGQQESLNRKRLICALLLFAHACHHTALVSRSILEIETGTQRQWEQAWLWADQRLRQLLQMRIIRQKPGGFLWLRAQMRERLLYELLQDANAKEVLEIQDTIHIGIADWYMTFFAATGDPLAVFQAVYHRCRVAMLCWDRSETLLIRARGALCEASNHLESARANILGRVHPQDAEKCLVGFISLLCRLFDEEMKKKERAAKGAEKRHERNLRLLIMLKTRAQRYLIWYSRDQGVSDRVLEYTGRLLEWRRHWAAWPPGKPRDTILAGFKSDWPEEEFLSEYAVKWEAAVARVSLRCYSSAIWCLEQLEGDFYFPYEALLSAKEDGDVWNIVDKWILERSTDARRYSKRRFLIYVLRRHIEVLLLQAEVERATENDEEKVAGHLVQAQHLYLAAQMLPRYITEEENSTLRVEHSRIHTIMAGILALRGDSQGVYRQINEAFVALSNLPRSEDPISHVVVDLRRIYCHLAGLEQLTWLQQFRAAYLNDDRREDLNADATEVEIAKAEAILTDAEHISHDVESRIKRDRKSRWWWLTHCRYKMVCFEYRQVIATWRQLVRHQRLDSISHRAAMDSANELMGDVCRRVTDDSFQLANVTEAFLNFYAFCTLRAPLPTYSLFALVDARLGEVIKHRERTMERWHNNRQLKWKCTEDPVVADFIKRVRERLERAKTGEL